MSFCLLYKGQSLKSDNFYKKAIIKKMFTCEIVINNLTCVISHVRLDSLRSTTSTPARTSGLSRGLGLGRRPK
jgi:hypothetical protein